MQQLLPLDYWRVEDTRHVLLVSGVLKCQAEFQWERRGLVKTKSDELNQVLRRKPEKTHII